MQDHTPILPLSLRWKIVLLLAVKAAALALIYVLWFGAAHEIAADADATRSHILRPAEIHGR